MNHPDLLQALRPTMKFPNFNTRHLAVLLLAHQKRGRIDFAKARSNLGIPRPALSRMVDALSILGFAKRVRNENDHRKIFIKTTPKGRAFIRSLETA
jgi:DNA-binding MarR family transcriptional regulator